MWNQRSVVTSPGAWLAGSLAVLVFVGCQSGSERRADRSVTAPPGVPAPSPVAATGTPPPAPPTGVLQAIRVNAGAAAPFTDSSGNVWLADQGFEGGDIVDRGSDLAIANTKDPAVYRTERYSMTGFSQTVPNGKYTVRLHFAETYEDISGAGERVFSFNVEGQTFKDFDVFARAGGKQKAYVETVNVEVTDGELDITFTSQVQNPEINGIEIIPSF